MSVAQQIHDALDLKKLDLPPKLKVRSIQYENEVDWASVDDSIRITVVIDDSVDEFKMDPADVTKLNLAIHDSLIVHGIQSFPYISLVKPSELEAAKSQERDGA